MADKTCNVLFLCTGNSARSVMAESLLQHMGQGRFRGFSAGSHPAGSVNPFTLEVLLKHGLPVDGLRSKSWTEFETSDAPKMDIVITVCDNAAGEVCPVWPGQPVTAHWGFEDPAAVQGTDERRRQAFEKVFREIRTRIGYLVNLPLERLDRLAIKRAMDDIGRREASA